MALSSGSVAMSFQRVSERWRRNFYNLRMDILLLDDNNSSLIKPTWLDANNSQNVIVS